MTTPERRKKKRRDFAQREETQALQLKDNIALSVWYAACPYKERIHDARLGSDAFAALLRKGLMRSFAPADCPVSNDSVRLRNPRIEKANPRRSLGGRACGSTSGEHIFPMRPQEEGTMLVLARKCGEAFVIADANIVITILELHGDRVRIGVEAPPEVTIYRREVWERIQDQDKLDHETRTTNSETASIEHAPVAS